MSVIHLKGATNSSLQIFHGRRKSDWIRKKWVMKCNSESRGSEIQKMVEQFNPLIPIEKAATPPTSWYTHPSFYQHELNRVFYKGWRPLGYTRQLKNPGDFFTGRVGDVEYVVCRDGNGELRAFHNVCRHHASLLASATGNKSCFVCPYHGWTYGLDGSLLKAPRVTEIQNFDPNEFKLIPLHVAIWGPFVLLNMDDELNGKEVDYRKVENEWLGSCSEILKSGGVDSSLSYVCRRVYSIECNWKVYCDNYLDGGYHVPYAHKDLASGLKLNSYTTTIHEKVSIQSCEGSSTESEDEIDRLGSKALYAFVYPNFMVNRYGVWMDTNLVIPQGPNKCEVIFDYYIESHLKDESAFIETSLADSERVQMEDIILCEGVQRGLNSPAYNCGRYAPTVEKAMHHFHSLLHNDLKE